MERASVEDEAYYRQVCSDLAAEPYGVESVRQLKPNVRLATSRHAIREVLQETMALMRFIPSMEEAEQYPEPSVHPYRSDLPEARRFVDGQLACFAARFGYGGGRLDGSSVATSRYPSITRAEYMRQLLTGSGKFYTYLLVISLKENNPLGQDPPSVPGIPKELPIAEPGCLFEALTFLKWFSAQKLDKVPNCADDVLLIYSAIWRNEGSEGDRMRSRVPGTIRRLFYQLDMIPRLGGSLEKAAAWIDANNLMNKLM